MKPSSLSHKVYLELRKKILSNQLVSGMRLKEDEWAQKMDVSRTAVREALTRLLGEDLVEFGKRGGYFIKSMTVEDVKEIREIREILETGALRLVIERISDEEIAELETICNDFTSMVEGGYLGGACEADVKFHETIIELSGNEKLKDIYLHSNIPLFHLKLGQSMTHMDDYELTDKEHREILDSIKKRDFNLAERTLHKHLIRGELTALDIS
ncbi:GntR family transcriptional regulator [Membranihabitans maritimus]|uniref:GntR family transcriptional regulator n=1 Tax=Membranihabitans maritimus TaxID=2904244 RepID=UPI001F2ED30D|nr:GntR family transcriptional regulator [Membranihabitans maritimus]